MTSRLSVSLRRTSATLARVAMVATVVALSACATQDASRDAAKAPQASNYPTIDRVQYVEECMRQHRGPHFEMLSKCSCTLDRLAQQLSYDDFSEMSTDANATTIGGERGGVMRDNEGVQSNVKKWRQLQADAKKACFINLDGPR